MDELLQLKELFKKYNSYIITEKTKSNNKLKDRYSSVFYLVYGTRRNILLYPFIFLFNIIKSFVLYFKIKPKVVVTTGTHTAVPMCYIAKLFRKKVIYIETFANRYSKTLAGKMIYPIADTFIVQWEEMLKIYPKAKYFGSVY